MEIEGKELRPIPGIPHYLISSTGDVWSLYRNQWIKQRTGTSGYMRVNVYEDGKMWSPEIHRMVALAWLDRPEDRDVVCHIDNNILNNDYRNLYWGTSKTNADDMVRAGTVKIGDNQKYRHNPRTYIVYWEGVEVGRYHSYKEVADALGMSLGRIAHNIIGDRKNKLGFTFEIIEPEEA